MKIVSFILSALLFSGTALSDSYRQVLRYTPHHSVRVVQRLPQQQLRVLPMPPQRARVTVTRPLPRSSHRPVAVAACGAVVACGPHFRPFLTLVNG